MRLSTVTKDGMKDWVGVQHRCESIDDWTGVQISFTAEAGPHVVLELSITEVRGLIGDINAAVIPPT